MKKTLHAVIEFAQNNLSAYLKEVDGIIGIGENMDEVRQSLLDSVRYCVEDCIEDNYPIPEPLRDEYEVKFLVDTTSFLQMYGDILSKSGLEKITGIHQKQLWHYASGKSKPRKCTVQKISSSVHKFAKELAEIEFA